MKLNAESLSSFFRLAFCRTTEFKLSLIVAPGQRRIVGMLVSQVFEVLLGLRRRVPTLLAHVRLLASLLVAVAVGDVVHLLAVRLQRAALRERLFTQVALVGADTCKTKPTVDK